MNGNVILELDSVQVGYPGSDGKLKYALDDVSISIGSGEFVAVIGHNGSGKSTLAKLCNGLLLPSSGRVWVDGMDTAVHEWLHAIHGVVGMVFQDPETQMVSTVVEEDVAFGLENYAVPPAEMQNRVQSALLRVGMWEHRSRAPHQLSGGQKQRVAIAAVMAMNPRCVIFDEATSMLDSEGRSAVMDALDELHRRGTTVVLVTHHMEEALHATRVVVMKNGKIVHDGPPDDVFSDVQRLHDWRVEPPITVEVAAGLRALGWEIEGTPLHAKALREMLKQAVVGKVPWHSYRPIPATLPLSDPIQTDSATPTVVSVRALSHAYLRGTPMEHASLDGVSVDIMAGEFVAVVGRTGSGKSTLIQHLNGLIRPQQGSVVVEGFSLTDKRTDVRQLRRVVGLAFQNPEDQLFEALVGDDVAYGPFQYGLPLSEVRDRVRFALEAVGLSFDWRDKPIHGLSGGERRKIALAGVLAIGPDILILDEPTAGLDPQSRREIAANLKRLQVDAGITVLWVTHQLEEAALYANRILVMADGHIVADTTPRALFDDEHLLSTLHLKRPGQLQLVADLRRFDMPIPEGATALTIDEAIHWIDHTMREERMNGAAWKS